MNNERNFLGVWIPKEIWLNKKLNMLEKVILVEIQSLDNEETHCIASNKYLADFCNCSEVKISQAISKLKDEKLIKIINFDGRIRVIECLMQPYKKFKADQKKINAINIDNTNDELLNNNINKSSLDNNKKNSKKDLLGNETKNDKKKNKKEILLDKLINEIIPIYNYSDKINDLLVLHLKVLADKNKLPTIISYKLILQDLKELNENDKIKCIEDSIKSSYPRFYIDNYRKKNVSIDGIDRNATTDLEDKKKQDEKLNKLIDSLKK